VQPNKRDRPNKLDRPNEQDRLADFFSILLVQPGEGTRVMSFAKAELKVDSPSPNTPQLAAGSFMVIKEVCGHQGGGNFSAVNGDGHSWW
jgi:hypothetical protein